MAPTIETLARLGSSSAEGALVLGAASLSRSDRRGVVVLGMTSGVEPAPAPRPECPPAGPGGAPEPDGRIPEDIIDRVGMSPVDDPPPVETRSPSLESATWTRRIVI